MNTWFKILLATWTLLLVACGPTGDTEGLKQDVEKNKLSITAVVIKPKYTLTLDPVSVSPANPKYYFDHNDAEPLQAFGITDANDEILLTNVSWGITDDSNTAGATTINQDGLLNTEALGTNQTKDIAVNIDFAGLTATADVVISSYPLSSSGLSLKINDVIVTSQPIQVCDTAILKAEGMFDDGSTRDVTSEINWSAALADVNAKFVSSDLNSPTFSSHTNATYVVTPDYKGQGTASMSFVVSEDNFENFAIDSSSVSIASGDSHTLSVTADINAVNTDVTSRAKWSSADKAIFTVSDSGAVTGVSSGGPISVTAQCGSASVASSVTVDIDTTIKSITILDENSDSIDLKTLFVDDTVNLKLRLTKTDESIEDITIDADTSWTIRTIPDKGNPITIDDDANKGLVTAIGVGTAVVVATYKGEENTLIVEVLAK